MSIDPVFFTSSILQVRERFVLKYGRLNKVPLRVRIGYFHHPKLGHTLIDTGYGSPVTTPAAGDLFLQIYRASLKPNIISDDPISLGLERLGLTCTDIKTVIITHFHADHIGGLFRLPNTKIICSRSAWMRIKSHGKLTNALEGVFSSLLPDDLEERLELLDASHHPLVRTKLGPAHDIFGDRSVLCVDLPGHLIGHFGLYFVETNFLYATDTQWLLKSIAEDRMPGFPASHIYHDRSAARQSVQRVANFLRNGGEVMLCHDPNVHVRDIDDDIVG